MQYISPRDNDEYDKLRDALVEIKAPNCVLEVLQSFRTPSQCTPGATTFTPRPQQNSGTTPFINVSTTNIVSKKGLLVWLLTS